MTDEIDWPMTMGTVALAAFLAWVVFAMYRPLQTRALDPSRSHAVHVLAAPVAHPAPAP